jgi:hypothetical protein
VFTSPRRNGPAIESHGTSPPIDLFQTAALSDNCRANSASQPLSGYYHTFGRSNSSFRRIRSSAPREKIRPVPLRLWKEQRDEEVGGLGSGEDSDGAGRPGPGAGECVGDGAMESQGFTTYQYGTHVVIDEGLGAFYALPSDV